MRNRSSPDPNDLPLPRPRTLLNQIFCPRRAQDSDKGILVAEPRYTTSKEPQDSDQSPSTPKIRHPHPPPPQARRALGPQINRSLTLWSPGTYYTALGRSHPIPLHSLPAPCTPQPRQALRPPGSAVLPWEPPPEPPPSGARMPRSLTVPVPRPLLRGDALRASLPGQRRRASGPRSPEEEKEVADKGRARPAAAAAPISPRGSACVRRDLPLRAQPRDSATAVPAALPARSQPRRGAGPRRGAVAPTRVTAPKTCRRRRRRRDSELLTANCKIGKVICPAHRFLLAPASHQ